MFETLKKRWSGDEEASEALENLGKKPERYQPILEDILKEKLEHNKGLADELQKLLNEMGAELEIIQKIGTAKDVTGLEADEMSRGKVKVTQKIERAEDVTGARIKHIG